MTLTGTDSPPAAGRARGLDLELCLGMHSRVSVRAEMDRVV